jgi:hypothetical protein
MHGVEMHQHLETKTHKEKEKPFKKTTALKRVISWYVKSYRSEFWSCEKLMENSVIIHRRKKRLELFWIKDCIISKTRQQMKKQKNDLVINFDEKARK